MLLLSPKSEKKIYNLLREWPRGTKALVTLNVECRHTEGYLTRIQFKVPKSSDVEGSLALKAKSKEETLKTKPKEESLKPKKLETFRAKDEKYYMSALTSRSNSLASVHEEESDVEVPPIETSEKKPQETFKPKDEKFYQRALTSPTSSLVSVKSEDSLPRDGSFIGRKVSNLEEIKYPKNLPTFKAKDEKNYAPALTSSTTSYVDLTEPSDKPIVLRMRGGLYHNGKKVIFGKAVDISTAPPSTKSCRAPSTTSTASNGAPSSTNSFVGKKVTKQKKIDYSKRQPRVDARDEPYYQKGGVSALDISADKLDPRTWKDMGHFLKK